MGAEGLKADARNGRLRFMGNEYWSDWMHEIAGQKVVLRFDPADLHAPVHVYAADNRYLGAAECHQKAGFLSVEEARSHNRARKDWMKAEKKALEAHRKLSARELGALLDETAPGEVMPAPEAKVVRMVQPHAKAPSPQSRDLSPDLSPEVKAAQAALVVEFSAAKTVAPASDETAKDRFGRALALERAIEAGGAITDEQSRWLRVYQSTPEYRAERMLWSDFGDAYFG
ncbi:Mu transposase C-terminal domain-containing protein [Rhodobacter sp. NTK016B]|uniref:Mu transposase C-terminal domain-containing protein n=1 Tax=Rhodobacter sp. NTK016B TaxID=2759676 RepID=UPI0025706CE6|nr:Mu transposase C-terminal domain-containing protein [Rhodobacter sp. NTK016B]